MCIRDSFATINPARRLRLYDVGGIAPGMRADLQLVRDLRAPRPELVLCGGEVVCREGRLVKALPQPDLSDVLRSSVRCAPVRPEDLVIAAPAVGTALVNVIAQDGVSLHTTRDVYKRQVPQGVPDGHHLRGGEHPDPTSQKSGYGAGRFQTPDPL